jgi:hypothetical protein
MKPQKICNKSKNVNKLQQVVLSQKSVETSPNFDCLPFLKNVLKTVTKQYTERDSQGVVKQVTSASRYLHIELRNNQEDNGMGEPKKCAKSGSCCVESFVISFGFCFHRLRRDNEPRS